MRNFLKMCNDRDDDKFISILQDNRSLPDFLDSIFGFLYRKTDFYTVTENQSIGIGLPEGYAESLVFNTFKRWQKIASEPAAQPETTRELNDAAKTNQFPQKSTQDNKAALLHENGAIFETYSWSQRILEIDIYVIIPDHIPVKNLKVHLNRRDLSVTNKTNNELIFGGPLSELCKSQSLLWSVENHVLGVHLEKVKSSWWKKLLESEPEINLSKIDHSEPISELSEQAKAKIDEILYKQELKDKGQFTRDETKVLNVLDEAWKLEGSPFEGEFDPDHVEIV